MNLCKLLMLFCPVMLIHAGIGDLRTMRIPNYVILLLFVGYLFTVPAVGLTLQDVIWSLTAACGVFVAGFFSFACRWMGGGDVKLLTVTALWLGAGSVVPFFLYTSVFGAFLTMLLIAFRLAPLPVSWRELEWICRLHRRDAGVPYGVAIAAAGILIYLQLPWVAARL